MKEITQIRKDGTSGAKIYLSSFLRKLTGWKIEDEVEISWYPENEEIRIKRTNGNGERTMFRRDKK